MNTYILILTLLFKTGDGGIGGVESIPNLSLEDCNRIGVAWIANITYNRRTKKSEAFFICVPYTSRIITGN